MAIQIGDKIPSVTLKRFGDGGLKDLETDEFFGGRKVVVFSVPGAFTPTCSNEHLPGYVQKADEIKSKGVDEIACLAVNDPFVMKAWAEAHDAPGKVAMLPDGNGELTKALGLEMDGSGACLGTRGKRFSMLVEDGVVKSLEVEENPGGVSVSGADACVAKL
jgi:peroxiredoxin